MSKAPSPMEKKSLVLASRKTSMSLEPEFWAALSQHAKQRGLSVAGLIARIDSERRATNASGSLASAVRVWLLEAAMADA